MAKKSRRARKSKKQPTLSAAQMVQPGAEADGSGRAQAAEPAALRRSTVDLDAEYVYVISDLKRIGAIAAGMLALLIVLAVVLI
jgi:hypothetical protein